MAAQRRPTGGPLCEVERNDGVDKAREPKENNLFGGREGKFLLVESWTVRFRSHINTEKFEC